MNRLLIASLAACAAFVLACGGGGGSAAPTTGSSTSTPTPTATPRKATLMLDWTPNTNHTGIYVAKQQGWYREAGIDLDIVEPSGTRASQVVGAGRAEFGITVAESLLPARQAGNPIVSIATIMPVNDSSLMAVDPSIRRPRDLQGKKYGGFGGQLERQLISELVKCDGGDPAKIDFVDVGNVDYIAGMDQHRFDFVWVFEGWDVVRAREVMGRPVNSIKFADYLQCIPNWYTPVFITNEQTAKNDPALARAFLAATSRGYQFAAAQPKEAADLLLRAVPELDRKLVTASATSLAPKYIASGKRWGEQDPAVWTTFEAYLRQGGLLKQALDVQAAYTNAFLPDAAPKR